jgi:hypothetical protein
MKPLRSSFRNAAAWRHALVAVWLALSASAASAKTVQLLCPCAEGSCANLATIDYSAQTLGYDYIDAAGNVTIMAYHRMPAQITDETVSAIWRNGPHSVRFTLNRYSGVMLTVSDFGAGVTTSHSKPCTPYQRGAKKF